jgi:hypothetical protein
MPCPAESQNITHPGIVIAIKNHRIVPLQANPASAETPVAPAHVSRFRLRGDKPELDDATTTP